MNKYINVPQFQTKCFYLIVKPINKDNSVCNLEFKINIISEIEFKRQLCCGGSGLPVITSVQSCYVRARTHSPKLYNLLRARFKVIVLLYRSHLVDIQLFKK